MEARHKAMLTKNTVFLKDNLEVSDDLIAPLVEDGILSSDNRERLQVRRTPQPLLFVHILP